MSKQIDRRKLLIGASGAALLVSSANAQTNGNYKKVIVRDYQELKSLASSDVNIGDVITVTNEGIAGDFVVDVGHEDNGGTLLSFADNYLARRIFTGALDVRWFEFSQSASAQENAEAVAKCCQAGSPVFFPKMDAQCATVTVNNPEIEIISSANLRNDGLSFFRLIEVNKFKLSGGSFAVTNYESNRPSVVESRKFSQSPNVSISDVTTTNCALCDLDIGDQEASLVISNNQVLSDEGTDNYVSASGVQPVSIVPWINILHSGQVEDNRQKTALVIENNIINVFHQSGSNVDLMKITGNLQNFHLAKNSFINKNLNSQAEVDTFGGGRFCKVIGNYFNNVSFKMQTHNSTKSEYNIVESNSFDFEGGCVNPYGALFKTSFINVSNNILRYQDSDRQSGNFIGFWFSEMNNPNNGFNGKLPVCNIICNNLIDLQHVNSTHKIKTMIIFNLLGSTFVGNILLGGEQISPPDSMTCTGNHFYTSLDNVSDSSRNALKHKFGNGSNIVDNSYGNLDGSNKVTTAKILIHSGSPESVVTADPGMICQDSKNGDLYRKAAGNNSVGWVKLT